MLSLIDDATVQLVEERRGVPLDLQMMPMDDPAVYELIGKGRHRSGYSRWRAGPRCRRCRG